MAMQVKWDDELQNTILFTAQGSWEWAEFWQTYALATALMNEHGQPTALIYDLDADAWRMPAGTLSNVRHFQEVESAFLAFTVAIHPGYKKSLANSMISVVGRFFPHVTGIRLASSLEEARAMVVEKMSTPV